MTGLCKDERETIILGSDAASELTIYTCQRSIITRLKHCVAATLVRQGKYGTSAWAEFTLPFELLSFRGVRRAATSPKQQAARARGLANALARRARTQSSDSLACSVRKIGAAGKPREDLLDGGFRVRESANQVAASVQRSNVKNEYPAIPGLKNSEGGSPR